MITKYWWEGLTWYCPEPTDYLLAIISSFISIPLDIVLSPFELLALVIYKFREKRRK